MAKRRSRSFKVSRKRSKVSRGGRGTRTIKYGGGKTQILKAKAAGKKIIYKDTAENWPNNFKAIGSMDDNKGWIAEEIQNFGEDGERPGGIDGHCYYKILDRTWHRRATEVGSDGLTRGRGAPPGPPGLILYDEYEGTDLTDFPPAMYVRNIENNGYGVDA